MAPMANRWLVAAAVTAALIPIVGCGLEKPTPPDERDEASNPAVTRPQQPHPEGAATPEPEYLTGKDLRRYEPSDPRRIVLRFWFAVQYRDLLSAYESLTAEFRREFSPSLRRFGTYVMADHGRWLTTPSMLFVEENGGRASVAVSYPLRGGGTERSAFSLERERGRWKIAYDFYLTNRLLGK